MSTIRFWFFGFRAGWWEGRALPVGAHSATDHLNRAYYAGYAVGAYLRHALRGG